MPATSTFLLATLAWRNLWRHPRRTTLILLALALGVWSMIVFAALSRGSVQQQFERAVRNLTGHVQIHAPDYRDDPVVEHRLPPPSPALREVLEGSGVVAWSARVRVPAIVSSERESFGVTLVGIDPEQERKLSFVADAVKEGDYLRAVDDPGVLLGRTLAERLETGVGRRVVLLGQDARNEIADRGFRVVGIYDTEPDSIETAYVFVGRTVAQAMLKIGEDVSEVAALTQDPDALVPLVDHLRAAAPAAEVRTWGEVEPVLQLMRQVTDAILMIWYVIVFLAISFGLVNTLFMAVFERTREFGLFQALGMKPRYIVGQVFVESLFMLLIGLAVGNALAWISLESLSGGLDLSAFARGLEMVGVGSILYPSVALGDIVGSNLLVMVLGCAASLYPAWRASRHVPVEAITRV